MVVFGVLRPSLNSLAQLFKDIRGNGYSAAVELTPSNTEIVGLIPARWWAFSVNVEIECQILPLSYHFIVVKLNCSYQM